MMVSFDHIEIAITIITRLLFNFCIPAKRKNSRVMSIVYPKKRNVLAPPVIDKFEIKKCIEYMNR